MNFQRVGQTGIKRQYRLFECLTGLIQANESAIGKQGGEELTAEEVGEQLGTNNYETVTTISARVPRVYSE